MKKYFVFIISFFFMVSCAKNDNQIKKDPSYSEFMDISSYNVTKDPLGWLIFTDRDHLLSTIAGLQDEDDNYENQFDNCINQIPSNLSYEAENAQLTNCGYLEDKKMIDFENLFSNFISIRSEIGSEQDSWLLQQTSPIDFSTMPDHFCNIPYVSSIFNEYGEVQVGGLVYFVRPDGKSIAVNRNELTYEIVQELRILISNPAFDVTGYQSTPVTNDSLKNAFLHGQQMQSKSGSKSVIVMAAGIILVATVIMAVYDFTLWTQPTPTGCYFDKDLLDSWEGNNKEIFGRLKWREFLVLGQNVFADEKYYFNIKKRLANLKLDGRIEFLVLANHNNACFNGSDGQVDFLKEKRRKKIKYFENVSFYHRTAIHENTTSHDFMHCDYYLDEDLKLTIH